MQAQKQTPSEKLRAYIAQKPEFKSEESLNQYYRQFDEILDADDEHMLEFWKNTIYEYAYSVENKFGVRVDELMKKFTLHDRVPCGLPLIMKELSRR